MRRRFNDEDDEERRWGWFWRFLRGVLVALVVSAAAVALISIYVLPPPEPEPAPEPAAPEIVSGIEVSKSPAYTGTPDANAEASGTEAAAGGQSAGSAAGTTAASTTGQPATGAGSQPSAEPALPSGPALTVNAELFEADLEKPLVAVVLDDTAANPLLHKMLFSLDLPITVGVVAGAGGDRETASAARAAGLEVVAELPIAAQGASGGVGLEYGLPEDQAAARTLALVQRLPMAVAVSRPLSAPGAPNESVWRGMSGVFGPLGFAYLDTGVALQGESAAAIAGAATGVEVIVGVSRFTIPAGATAADAVAVLDQAAADAVERGGSVVIAAPSDELALALQLWGGEGVGSLAQLAPLSAVIRRQFGR